MLFFPIGDEDRSRKSPWMVYTLIFLNIGVYGFSVMEGREGFHRVVRQFGLQTGSVNTLSLVTHMFLHAGLGHLLLNMLFLWIFGDNLERILGSWIMLPIYLLMGAAAGGVHVLSKSAPAIGASGAIFGVIGMYLVLFPTNHVSIFYFIFFDADIVKVPAWVFLLLFEGVQQIIGFLSNTEGIAFAAHLGGLGTGVLLGYLAKFIPSIQEYLEKPILTAPNERAIRRKFNRRKREAMPTSPEDLLGGTQALFNREFSPIRSSRIKEILREKDETGKVIKGNEDEAKIAFPVVNLTRQAADDLVEELQKEQIDLVRVESENVVDFPSFENLESFDRTDSQINIKTETGDSKKLRLEKLYLVSAGLIELTIDEDEIKKWFADLLFVNPWICYRLGGPIENSGDANEIINFLREIREEEPSIQFTPGANRLVDGGVESLPSFPDLNTFEQFSLWEMHRQQVDELSGSTSE